jgi:hypothetical protein
LGEHAAQIFLDLHAGSPPLTTDSAFGYTENRGAAMLTPGLGRHTVETASKVLSALFSDASPF